MKKSKFHNLDGIEITASFKNVLRWRRERSSKQKDFSFVVPQAVDKNIPFLVSNRTETTLTWIGHATFLIQIAGLNILTDPVWANRMGLHKRLSPAGIPLNEMPEIDVVLISHNHYDHLDFNSLSRLKGRPRCFVPKGLYPLFSKKGFSGVTEFDWWERTTIDDVHFTFVPAQHWSKRTLWDTNRSLWGGWVISLAGLKSPGIYFVGDSGYFRGFKEIGARFTPDYVLAPIGCYEPEWFMCVQHMTPEEAVQAYLDSKAENLVPMHYEAFQLGDDTPQEAITRLKCEWERLKIDHKKLKILRLGETIHL